MDLSASALSSLRPSSLRANKPLSTRGVLTFCAEAFLTVVDLRAATMKRARGVRRKER
jgi:hypothetical protein